MKTKITEEKKEEFLVAAYSYLSELKKEIKRLESELVALNVKKKDIEKVLKPLEEEYEKIILSIKGEGIYSDTVKAPAQIRNRIGKLEHSIQNPYREDDRKKQYELLKRPLEEDLEMAKQKAEEFEKYEKNIVQRLIEEREKMKSCKKEIKACGHSIDKNKKESEKVHLQIRKVEKAFSSGKNLDTRVLVLDAKKTDDN